MTARTFINAGYPPEDPRNAISNKVLPSKHLFDPLFRNESKINEIHNAVVVRIRTNRSR